MTEINVERTKKFLLLAAICCLLTVITTLGIHAFFDYGPLNFEERIQLFQNPMYLLNRWWVIVHCLLVLVGMWGFFLVQFKKSPGFAGLGFLFFAVFAFTEIYRQLFVLFYLNGLRQKYIATDDEGIRAFMQYSLENVDLINLSLFGMFIFAFGLGNLCYGISLIGGDRYDKILSVLLLAWSLQTLVIFFNEFWAVEWIWKVAEPLNIIYQPVVRLLLGLWLFQKFRKI